MADEFSYRTNDMGEVFIIARKDDQSTWRDFAEMVGDVYVEMLDGRLNRAKLLVARLNGVVLPEALKPELIEVADLLSDAAENLISTEAARALNVADQLRELGRA